MRQRQHFSKKILKNLYCCILLTVNDLPPPDPTTKKSSWFLLFDDGRRFCYFVSSFLIELSIKLSLGKLIQEFIYGGFLIYWLYTVNGYKKSYKNLFKIKS